MKTWSHYLLIVLHICLWSSSISHPRIPEYNDSAISPEGITLDRFTCIGREVGTGNELVLSFDIHPSGWADLGSILDSFFTTCVFRGCDENGDYTIIRSRELPPYCSSWAMLLQREDGTVEVIHSEYPYVGIRKNGQWRHSNQIRINGRPEEIFDPICHCGEWVNKAKWINKAGKSVALDGDCCYCLEEAYLDVMTSVMDDFLDDVGNITYLYSRSSDRYWYYRDKKGEEHVFRNKKKRSPNFYRDSISATAQRCLLSQLTIKKNYQPDYFPKGTIIIPITKIDAITEQYDGNRNPEVIIWLAFYDDKGEKFTRALKTVRNNEAVELAKKWRFFKEKGCLEKYQYHHVRSD